MPLPGGNIRLEVGADAPLPFDSLTPVLSPLLGVDITLDQRRGPLEPAFGAIR